MEVGKSTITEGTGGSDASPRLLTRSGSTSAETV